MLVFGGVCVACARAYIFNITQREFSSYIRISVCCVLLFVYDCECRMVNYSRIEGKDREQIIRVLIL